MGLQRLGDQASGAGGIKPEFGAADVPKPGFESVLLFSFFSKVKFAEHFFFYRERYFYLIIYHRAKIRIPRLSQMLAFKVVSAPGTFDIHQLQRGKCIVLYETPLLVIPGLGHDWQQQCGDE